MSFRTPDEVDAWLFKNPMHCPGAVHFVEKNSTVISYGIQTNSTSLIKRGQTEDPTFKFQIPLQIAAEREIARSLLGGITYIQLMTCFCAIKDNESYLYNFYLTFTVLICSSIYMVREMNYNALIYSILFCLHEINTKNTKFSYPIIYNRYDMWKFFGSIVNIWITRTDYSSCYIGH